MRSKIVGLCNGQNGRTYSKEAIAAITLEVSKGLAFVYSKSEGGILLLKNLVGIVTEFQEIVLDSGVPEYNITWHYIQGADARVIQIEHPEVWPVGHGKVVDNVVVEYALVGFEL